MKPIFRKAIRETSRRKKEAAFLAAVCWDTIKMILRLKAQLRRLGPTPELRL
jgi:hypothetical protein